MFASPSALGWAFQINLLLVLCFDWITSAKITTAMCFIKKTWTSDFLQIIFFSNKKVFKHFIKSSVGASSLNSFEWRKKCHENLIQWKSSVNRNKKHLNPFIFISLTSSRCMQHLISFIHALLYRFSSWTFHSDICMLHNP